MFIFLVVLVIYSTIYRKKELLKIVSAVPVDSTTLAQIPSCGIHASVDIITPVPNSKVFLFTAYLDFRRNRIVRIIGITHRKTSKKLFCLLCFSNDSYSIAAEIQVHTDHFDFPYATTDLLCNLIDQRIPRFILVYHGFDPIESGPLLPFLKIKNQEVQLNALLRTFQYEFVVCISTMFGHYNNVLQFIQMIEMYRILGAQKVIIYKTNCSPLVMKVLSYYQKLDIIEIIPWPITKYLNVSLGWNFPVHPGEIHYHGQLVTLNDCIYRNMYRTRYVCLNDIDEIIIPVAHQNWHDMMESLRKQNPEANIFQFDHHLFPIDMSTENSSSESKAWNSVPGINILQYSYRKISKRHVFNPVKMIINPRAVIKTSVHSALEYFGKQIQVSMGVGMLCHYRNSTELHREKDISVKDKVLWKYKEKLTNRVNHVIDELGLLDRQEHLR
uniref:Glycosyltransferase family 92 protein n=1 Tax=Geotrypetes seraphini TaxID=260995 RepID=A0A6P8SN55_GEOSA|nr:beta-1,4-galactosyltransferase galt-1-like [Geotrypetes seraphini]